MCIRRPVTLHNCRITKHRTVETIFPLIPRTNTSETTSSSIAGEGSNMTRYDVVCTFTSPQIFIFTFLCPWYLTLPPLSFASNPTTLSLLSPSSTTPPLFAPANYPLITGSSPLLYGYSSGSKSQLYITQQTYFCFYLYPGKLAESMILSF